MKKMNFEISKWKFERNKEIIAEYRKQMYLNFIFTRLLLFNV